MVCPWYRAGKADKYRRPQRTPESRSCPARRIAEDFSVEPGLHDSVLFPRQHSLGNAFQSGAGAAVHEGSNTEFVKLRDAIPVIERAHEMKGKDIRDLCLSIEVALQRRVDGDARAAQLCIPKQAREMLDRRLEQLAVKWIFGRQQHLTNPKMQRKVAQPDKISGGPGHGNLILMIYDGDMEV